MGICQRGCRSCVSSAGMVSVKVLLPEPRGHVGYPYEYGSGVRVLNQRVRLPSEELCPSGR